jgi:hypothetical protein
MGNTWVKTGWQAVTVAKGVLTVLDNLIPYVWVRFPRRQRESRSGLRSRMSESLAPSLASPQVAESYAILLSPSGLGALLP